MRRRDMLTGLLLAGVAQSARAQQSRVYRVGWISSTASAALPFRRRLAELGYVEGRNLVFEARQHKGHLEHVPELAAALVRSRPEIIAASGPQAVLKSVMAATKSIPILMAAIDYDPVALGYVKSLARPGGNVTGLYLQQAEITAKRVELLKEAIPALTDIAALADAFTPATSEQMHMAETAARRLQVRLDPVVVPGAPPYDFAAAITAARGRGAGALLALMSPAFFYDRARFVLEVLRQHMPASFGLREFADLGGLMSYGADLAQTFRRLADYADKILKGANPAELPIEQPSKFELILNLKTAKALGLTIPPLLLARADEVIE